MVVLRSRTSTPRWRRNTLKKVAIFLASVAIFLYLCSENQYASIEAFNAYAYGR